MKALPAAEMREVDRPTTERYGISGLQLMETAGKHVADAVRQRCAVLQPRRIVILCGKGNNGGGGGGAGRPSHASLPATPRFPLPPPPQLPPQSPHQLPPH